MKLKALRNVLVNGQHFDEGAVFETDIETAAKLMFTGKVQIAPEQTKQPMDDEPAQAAPAKKAKR